MKKTICSFFIFLIFVNFSACTDRTGKTPVLGSDPISSVHVFDNHKQSYQIWKTNNIKNEIVLHLDTHLDLNWLSRNDISLIDNKTPFGSSHNLVMSQDNYLYPAVKNGLIKKIYWLVPDQSWPDETTMLSWIRETFNQHQIHITSDEIKSFRRRGKVYQGRMYNTDIIICNLENLPPLSKGVLLDLDLDYFMFNSFQFTQAQLPHTADLWAFIEKIDQKKIPVKMITIATSISKGYTPLIYRFWGEALKRYWQDPLKTDQQFWSVFDLQSSAVDAYIDKDYHEAKQLILKAQQLNPDNSDINYCLRQIEIALGNKKEAEIAFNSSLPGNSYYQQTYLFMARYAFNQEKPQESEELYQKYLKANPDDPEALIEMGDLLFNMGRDKEAWEYADLAMKIDNKYDNVYILTGNLLQATPNTEPQHIFEAYTTAKSLGPESMNFYDFFGNYYLSLGNSEQAEKAFLDACRLGPNYDEAYNNLGYFYTTRGLNKKAQDALIKIGRAHV